METIQTIIIICLGAYLAGSVNFAIIFFKLAGKADPRLSFTGNAGTTNVYRQAGILWALIVFLLDIGRALGVAILAKTFLDEQFLPWVCFFLVLGNSFPLFHGFRGGKGVANFMGFTALVAPWIVLLASIIWVSVYGLYRVTFIASFFMTFLLAMGQVYSFGWTLFTVTGAIATLLLMVFNHRSNIIEFRKNKQKIEPSGG